MLKCKESVKIWLSPINFKTHVIYRLDARAVKQFRGCVADFLLVDVYVYRHRTRWLLRSFKAFIPCAIDWTLDKGAWQISSWLLSINILPGNIFPSMLQIRCNYQNPSLGHLRGILNIVFINASLHKKYYHYQWWAWGGPGGPSTLKNLNFFPQIVIPWHRANNRPINSSFYHCLNRHEVHQVDMSVHLP